MRYLVTTVKATKKVTVFISPPGNEVITDEDSGDEKNVQLHNLPRNQIIADATVAATHSSASAMAEQRKLKLHNWIEEDLPQSIEELEHIVIRPSVADYPCTPSDVLELFLDDEAIEHLTAETIKYAFQSGNHNFVMSAEEMRTFIGILLLSGYSSVPR